MKLLEKEEVVVRTPRQVVGRPVAKPTIAVRARVVTRPAKRKRGFDLLAARATAFAAIVGLTYVSSTLAGYVALERARQSARHGAERAGFARREAKEAREAIESLTNPTALHAWANSRGFVAEEAPVPPHGGGLVARL
jgi:hypothetical protein